MLRQLMFTQVLRHYLRRKKTKKLRKKSRETGNVYVGVNAILRHRYGHINIPIEKLRPLYVRPKRCFFGRMTVFLRQMAKIGRFIKNISVTNI